MNDYITYHILLNTDPDDLKILIKNSIAMRNRCDNNFWYNKFNMIIYLYLIKYRKISMNGYQFIKQKVMLKMLTTYKMIVVEKNLYS